MSTTIYSSPLDSILHIYIQLLTLQSAFAPKGVFTPLGVVTLLSALRFMLPLLL